MNMVQQGPTPDASDTVRGLMGLGAQTFAGAKTFTGTIKPTAVVAVEMAANGRIYAGAGGNYIDNHGASGLWQSTSGWRANIAGGQNAFLAVNTGARFKLSDGVASDYFYSDGSMILTPGDFACGTNLYTTVVRGGTGAANTINLHPSAGIYLHAASSGAVTLDDAIGGLLVVSGRRTTVSGDATSPVRGAFRIVPQDAEPTGPCEAGEFYVTTAGVLKIYTGSAWVSVGAQT